MPARRLLMRKIREVLRLKHERGLSLLHGWPRFVCDCHYLQIHGRDLYVHTKGPVGKGPYKLLENVVSDKDDRLDARVVVGEGSVKGAGQVFGYWRGKAGYLFPKICPEASGTAVTPCACP